MINSFGRSDVVSAGAPLLPDVFPHLLSALAAFVLQIACSDHSTAAHPLDPLSHDEIEIGVAALRKAGTIDATTRFALIDLAEPDKAEVLTWRPGQPFVRRAFVVARQRQRVYEGMIDLAASKVEHWQAIPDVQSAIQVNEWRKAQQITIGDPRWQAAVRRRGYDLSRIEVFCAPLSAGYFADPSEAGRRLIRVTCFDTVGTTNVWGHPIEGLYALVDLDASRVVRLADSGSVPVSREPFDFDRQSPAGASLAAKSAINQAPTAAHFSVTGNKVRWNNWRFHYRLDRRTGLVLSLVRYEDRGRERMVLYRGSLAEMFVPYMDPDPGWSFRAAMDVGEYGFGPLSLPLTPGSDCPSEATFLDAVLADDAGVPQERKSVICLFERATGSPLWRHAETANNTYAGRSAVELVMRTIPSVGNYDYVIDWVLTEAGEIRINAGATGIAEVKGVRARTLADASAAKDTTYGNLVAPNLVAVNHDHFLSFRLDLDIDGRANTLVRQRLVRERLPGNVGRRSLWRVVEDTVGVEGPLRGKHAGVETWRIFNPNLTNSLGQHPGYELRPGHSATSLLAVEDFPQRRAGFLAAPLWVTAYGPSELYAAGMYPNQSRGGGGLPAYVARHRPIVNADIVLWYTMGFHHLPRPEDWPVLPTIWHSMSLVPYGFFDRNPALDVARDAAAGDGAK